MSTSNASFTTLRAFTQSFKSFHALDQFLDSQRIPIVEAAAKEVAKAVDENADGKKRKNGAQNSRGVEKLKKANTKGMAKLSTFFKKPVEPAKA